MADQQDTLAKSMTLPPPKTIRGILRKLGPGLIVAGSIVGSGELIATTSTGAQAGFWLLWLILIGCVIKVFVQVELGRYAVTTGNTTMTGFAEVPGPSVPRRGNWLIWYWFIMFLASIAQLGGIVGGVGQALSISAPVSPYGAAYNRFAEAETELIVEHTRLRLLGDQPQHEPERDVVFARLVALNRQAAQNLAILLERQREKLYGKSTDEGGAAAIDRLTRQMESSAWMAEMLDPFASGGDSAKPPTETQIQVGQLLLELHQLNELQQQRDELAESLDTDSPEQTSNDGTDESTKIQAELALLDREIETIADRLQNAASAISLPDLLEAYRDVRAAPRPDAPIDDKLWAGLVTLITVFILMNGRFGLIQSFSTAMVTLFTAITVVNLIMLQSNPTWGVSLSDIINGMRFRLPPDDGDGSGRGLAMALQTFGIIGVGASELVTYPYWCLEKGYARFCGPRDDSQAWVDRARGWLRVMRWDAWCSMFIYTFATIAFYLLGAAVLGRSQLHPEGNEMIRYLSVMYRPVFGDVAQAMFLIGAFAVLYSTFFVANASHARVFGDAVRVMGLASPSEKAYRRRVRILSGVFPIICFVIYVFIPKPTQLVLLSGLMQAIMLPMLAGAALFFRYRRADKRITPGTAWDLFLWISAIGMLISGGWAFITKIQEMF